MQSPEGLSASRGAGVTQGAMMSDQSQRKAQDKFIDSVQLQAGNA
jgi:hypothetical protein